MPARPAIDPIALLGEAVRLAVLHRAAYLRIAAVPFALCAALLLWAALRDGAALVAVAAMALSLLVMLPVATAWHRFLILGRGIDREWLELRLGAAEWRYVAALTKIGALTCALALPLALAAATPASWLLAVLAALLIPVPFLLTVPAAAVEEPARLRDSEMLSRGERPGLCGLALLLCALALLAEACGVAAATLDPSGMIGILVSELAAYALLPVWTGALSLAYLRLCPLAPPQADTRDEHNAKGDYPSG